jgi:hypothetical protein
LVVRTTGGFLVVASVAMPVTALAQSEGDSASGRVVATTVQLMSSRASDDLA